MDTMKFPSTWKEFADKFSFIDCERKYTNGTKLIPVFRVEQWLEHISRGESMREEYDFLQDRINMLMDKKAVLIEKYNGLKEENQELREKLDFFEQGQPHPCTFDGKRNTSECTLRDWHTKLLEEVGEVEVEINKLEAKGKNFMDDITKEEDIERLTEELLDVITVSTSVLDWLGWSVYGRLQKQKEVNEKNRKRGYWK